MKFNYDKETDSLYIDLANKFSIDSAEVSTGIILDYDENNNVVGIDIQNASKIVDLSKIEADSLPLTGLA